MIKPFLDGLTKGKKVTPLHFCVDEGSQKRKQLAELLAAEDGSPALHGGYNYVWCLGALEAESGNLDEARQWLKNWAPTRQDEVRM